jgi:hypothetical protein
MCMYFNAIHLKVNNILIVFHLNKIFNRCTNSFWAWTTHQMRRSTGIVGELYIWLAIVYFLKCAQCLYSIFIILELNDGSGECRSSLWTCTSNQMRHWIGSGQKCTDVENEPTSGKNLRVLLFMPLNLLKALPV